jgi:intracellular multiplication protein IcmJ
MAHSIQLALNPQNWDLYLRRRADPAFRPVRDQIFQRDLHTCQFCGFQARSYQEVVNLDGNYRNNKLTNMVTACVFCAQCFFIDAVGNYEFGGGKLIYLPEMSQTELNSLCHVLFCAMANGTDYQDAAQALYRTLKFRSQQVEKVLGAGTSEPNVFGRMLLEYGKDVQKLSSQLLANMRLLPTYGRFKQQLEKWAASAAEELAAKA